MQDKIYRLIIKFLYQLTEVVVLWIWQEAQDIGVAFDRLRKTYPKRLEFAHFAVGKSHVSDGEGELLQDYLGALGFAAVKHDV